MGYYDSADMLARCKRHAQLPPVDESMDDPDWFAILTEKHRAWVARVAAIYPEPMWTAPTMLTSSDGGATYTFGDDVDGNPLFPLGTVQVFRQESDASQPEGPSVYALRPGIHFRHEGDRLRMSTTSPPFFPDGGPWARYVAPPGPIDATHAPVLYPLEARELVVLDAVATWAAQGGLRDPSPFRAQIAQLWSGDPMMRGDNGLLGMLKTQWFASAAPAHRRTAGMGRPMWGAPGRAY